MCGIFGWIASSHSDMPMDAYKKGIQELFMLSEMRGKEASGMCSVNQKDVRVYKRCIRASKLVHTDPYRDILATAVSNRNPMIMGHARMVTNGSRDRDENNQPVIRNDLICIHNGIIVNDLEIWNQNPEMIRKSEVDTEVFLALMEKYNYQDDLLDAFQKCISEIKGSLSIALIDKTSNYLMLYTNTGSLYVVVSADKEMILFASERYILEQTIKRRKLGKWFQLKSIKQILPGNGILVDIESCRKKAFNCNKRNVKISKGSRKRKLINVSVQHEEYPRMVYQNSGRLHKVEKLLQVDTTKIATLKRCTKCLLPETFPGIFFNEEGVCSVCLEYQRKIPKGEGSLRNLLRSQKSENSRYDCIVPLSGGRDSCYMLHYIVKELGLKPIAYTYDWGMVTDLARRNIQRMCSELGVEHILISADIIKKRKNIQLNVKAWLRHPELATVPLFMAGDKQFFYYAQMLKKQMKVDTIIFGMNSLEETQFKVRFASIRETGNGGIHYDLSAKNKYNLLMLYAKEFIKNPAYINRSLIDSFMGFCSYYLLPKDYVQFFDYIQWKQEIIEDVILRQYDWEKAKGTDETWRIGDGTAPFYNYIYYKMAGFTEFDTFKSNQIREGMVDREHALLTLEKSNCIPVEDFVWYCDTIDIDPIEALKVINRQRTLYDK